MPTPANIVPIEAARPKVIEFFAGVGLARLGLEAAGYRVAWANDYEPDKHAMYEAHFRDAERGNHHVFELGDVFKIDR